MKRAAYPKYKPSGVEYLGDVPAGWTVHRLKHTLEKIYSGGTPDTGNEVFWSDDDSGIPWVAIADMTATQRLKSTAKKITEEGKQSKQLPVLPRGTILYSMYASLGKVAVLEIPAVVNQAILGMIPTTGQLAHGYLAYWLHNMERHIFLMSSSNTQSNLNAEKVRNMPIYLPSFSEQKGIVKFLDLETAKTDALVEKKQTLIARLKEKRGALITRAVTKGLNPDAPMKDSGVEYLGEVPAHWDVRRLKHWVCLNKSVLPENTETDFEFEYLDIGSVGTGILTKTPQRIQFSNAPSRARRIVREGDTVISTVRTYLKAVWFAERIGENLIASTGFAVLCPDSDTNPKFVSYLACSDSFTDRVAAKSVGVTYPAIDESNLGKIKVVVPPLPEQTAITDFLNRETGKIDALIAKVEETIERLKEHRSALISAAVTGRIDVRAAK